MLFSFTLLIPLQAQVANDDIARRRVLRAEEPARSNTSNCTVQWNCVEESLTGKCIQYHNDQWFEFTPPVAGRYFVNIGGQQCRDVRGVQLVVLTGTPCQPATYRVRSCTSLGSQNDVFVMLDSLRAGQPYLLNVDGYLRDFCQFTLTVSKHHQGLPALDPPPPPAAPQASRLVTLRWTLADSVGTVPEFQVWRREAAETRAARRAAVPVARTTYGGAAPDYAFTDTLAAPGRYLYQVVAGATVGPPVVVQQQWYNFSPLPTNAPPPTNERRVRQQVWERKQWEKRATRMRRRHPAR
ncbi:hypothetical protein [Hymenobacter rubripertinctus]|uniref:Uncharacterized protein n=1 Tax=Hymenobacter rubripertinctus TaxID=2029981 RepID=A0A418R1L0_9BACT|nr:hypothetical protein [Hymenobacter rubripertinctus]RIY11295.1 hypothetical protein D0T11_07475 [Hymenobacter rubripertinctus]